MEPATLNPSSSPEQVFEVETSPSRLSVAAADRCQELASMVQIPGEKIDLQCYDTSLVYNSAVSNPSVDTKSSEGVVDSSTGANIGMIVGTVAGVLAAIAIGEQAWATNHTHTHLTHAHPTLARKLCSHSTLASCLLSPCS